MGGFCPKNGVPEKKVCKKRDPFYIDGMPL